MDKEKIIEILRKHVQVIHTNGQTYSFSLYFDKVAEDISNQIDCRVKPEIADVNRITMWVDMIWNDIFDDDKLPLTAAQMNTIGKYIYDAKEKIRKQFSV